MIDPRLDNCWRFVSRRKCHVLDVRRTYQQVSEGWARGLLENGNATIDDGESNHAIKFDVYVYAMTLLRDWRVKSMKEKPLVV